MGSFQWVGKNEKGFNLVKSIADRDELGIFSSWGILFAIRTTKNKKTSSCASPDSRPDLWELRQSLHLWIFPAFGCWKPLFRSKFLDQIRIQSPLQFGVKQFNHPIWCCPQSITFQTETIGPFFLEKEKKRIENYLKIVVIIFTLLLLALFLRCVPLALELWFLVYTKIMWILCISQVFWTCYYGLSLACNLRVSWRSELVRMFLINSSPYTSNTAKRCTWVVFFSVARP